MERPPHQPGTHTGTFWRRVGAVIVDAILVGIVAGPIGELVSGNPIRALSISGAIAALLTFAYFSYMEGTYGQTLGKALFKIVVVTEDGQDCEMDDAVIRNLLRFIDAIPGYSYLIGAVAIFITDDDQRLGDLVADTLVARVAE